MYCLNVGRVLWDQAERRVQAPALHTNLLARRLGQQAFEQLPDLALVARDHIGKR